VENLVNVKEEERAPAYTPKGGKDYVRYDFANSILLRPKEWAAMALLVAALYLALPAVWRRLEPVELAPDHRIPYELSNDYWLFGRTAERAGAAHETLVVGDSVVWGEYVRPDGTLSHYLNELAGKPDFANLGLNGMQPATMPVLLGSYAPSLAGKKILLQCNPLWMTSDLRDLTASDPQRLENFKLNHPALVPQFAPWIAALRADTSQRLSYAVQRNLEFGAWTNHLQVAYFDSRSVPSWTLDHPYENPARAVTLRGLSASEDSRHGPENWKEQGIAPQPFEWVDPAKSLQWRCFREAVDLLRRRGNRVFVLVGPFNEHMIAPEGREGYDRLKRAIAGWLAREAVPCLVPEALSSELYGDASHPFAAGYQELARQIWSHAFFRGSSQ
jgi:hypothetical protein